MEYFQKYVVPLNIVTGASLAFIYMEFINVGKHALLSSYSGNLFLNMALYSLVHTLVYYRVYLAVSNRQSGEQESNVCAQSWVYAIFISLGVVLLIKIGGST
ncbi:hypothetical protein [Alteromonas mediterranea]|uniref:hypothetical protein n=1 Tax=Alteromonas mediterranea TaxID=314275 RepID=UPI002FE2825A|tara:strand:+ start:1023 stop:1328 length:306 start_codon:yes stop_codon:yes gene_type:complete